MEPDIIELLMGAFRGRNDARLPGLNVMPPEERREGVPFDPGDQGSAESRQVFEDLMGSSFVQDTLGSVLQTLNPGVEVGTKGKTHAISNIVGEFFRDEDRIDIEAEFPKAARVGILPAYEGDAAAGLRQVLSHEVGHAVGPTVYGRVSEPKADLIARMFTELSRTNRDPGATRQGLIESVLTGENTRRETMNALAGEGAPAAYTDQIDPFLGGEFASDFLNTLLDQVPIYSAHPARFND